MTEARQREIRCELQRRVTAIHHRLGWVLRGALDSRDVVETANQLMAVAVDLTAVLEEEATGRPAAVGGVPPEALLNTSFPGGEPQ